MEAHIPNSLVPYYDVSDISLFVDNNIASHEEAMQIESYAKALIESTDRTFLGWAIVKPEYREKLSEPGLGFVCIVTKGSRTQLVAVYGETLDVISEAKIKKYL